jgi:hypothetical protein
MVADEAFAVPTFSNSRLDCDARLSVTYSPAGDVDVVAF